MGLYTRVLVPIYDSCFALGSKLFFHQRHKQCAIFYSTFWVSVKHHMLWAMKQRPSVFVPPTFLLVALFVMFSGAQRIYHSQEWPSNDYENDNQILKEIKNVINELTHLVWTEWWTDTLTKQRTRTKWVYLSEMVMISIDFNAIYL